MHKKNNPESPLVDKRAIKFTHEVTQVIVNVISRNRWKTPEHYFNNTNTITRTSMPRRTLRQTRRGLIVGTPESRPPQLNDHPLTPEQLLIENVYTYKDYLNAIQFVFKNCKNFMVMRSIKLPVIAIITELLRLHNKPYLFVGGKEELQETIKELSKLLPSTDSETFHEKFVTSRRRLRDVSAISASPTRRGSRRFSHLLNDPNEIPDQPRVNRFTVNAFNTIIREYTDMSGGVILNGSAEQSPEFNS